MGMMKFQGPSEWPKRAMDGAAQQWDPSNATAEGPSYREHKNSRWVARGFLNGNSLVVAVTRTRTRMRRRW